MTKDTRVQLLETSERVKNLLGSTGVLTLAQLTKQLRGRRELVNFAVGWLAHEDRIEISLEEGSFRLRLK